MNNRLKEIRDYLGVYIPKDMIDVELSRTANELLKMVDELQAQLKAVTPYLKHSTPSNHCDYMKHSDNPCTCGLEAAIKAKP